MLPRRRSRRFSQCAQPVLCGRLLRGCLCGLTPHHGIGRRRAHQHPRSMRRGGEYVALKGFRCPSTRTALIVNAKGEFDWKKNEGILPHGWPVHRAWHHAFRSRMSSSPGSKMMFEVNGGGKRKRRSDSSKEFRSVAGWRHGAGGEPNGSRLRRKAPTSPSNLTSSIPTISPRRSERSSLKCSGLQQEVSHQVLSLSPFPTRVSRSGEEQTGRSGDGPTETLVLGDSGQAHSAELERKGRGGDRGLDLRRTPAQDHLCHLPSRQPDRQRQGVLRLCRLRPRSWPESAKLPVSTSLGAQLRSLSVPAGPTGTEARELALPTHPAPFCPACSARAIGTSRPLPSEYPGVLHPISVLSDNITLHLSLERSSTNFHAETNPDLKCTRSHKPRVIRRARLPIGIQNEAAAGGFFVADPGANRDPSDGRSRDPPPPKVLILAFLSPRLRLDRKHCCRHSVSVSRECRGGGSPCRIHGCATPHGSPAGSRTASRLLQTQVPGSELSGHHHHPTTLHWSFSCRIIRRCFLKLLWCSAVLAGSNCYDFSKRPLFTGIVEITDNTEDRSALRSAASA